MKTRKKVFLCCAVLLCTSALVASLVANASPPGSAIVRTSQQASAKPETPVYSGPTNAGAEAPADTGSAGLTNTGGAAAPVQMGTSTLGTIERPTTGTAKTVIKSDVTPTGPSNQSGVSAQQKPQKEGKPALTNSGDLASTIPPQAPLYPPTPGRALAFDLTPGTGAPPGTLGGYLMTPFPPDPTPTMTDVTSLPSPCGYGSIAFSSPMNHRKIGSGWASWSHGYTGDVYYSNGQPSVTVSLPVGSCAFYFYVEPNPFSEIYFTATGNDGTSSGSFPAHGSAGAVYVGIFGAGLSSVTIATDDGATDFAIGEFGIACYCEPVFGACCDAGTGICLDGIAPLDCQGPYMHWYLNEQCAELEPLCVDRTGACCVDLVCVATNYEPQCLALGGRWFPGETCPEFVCPEDCEHKVVLWDCYGDGWNGNTLDVLVNGVPVLTGITLGSGAGPAEFTFMAGNGMTIQTVYNAIGSWTNEPYYFIYDGAGYQIAQDGIVGSDCYQTPTGISVEGNCMLPTGACCVDQECVATVTEDQCALMEGTWWIGEDCSTFVCPAGCFHTIKLYDCYGDGWNGNTLDVIVDGELVLDNITLGSGAGPATFQFMAANASVIQTIYNVTGSWVYEPYYYIYDGVGLQIGQDGIVGTDCNQQPTGITARGNCEPPTGACCGDGIGTLGCIVVPPDTCTALGGDYLGNFTECSGLDCNANETDDGCDLAGGFSQDCNENGIPDDCDIASGTSTDCQPDGIPDECQDDCNGNGIADTCDIADCTGEYWCLDCQPDGIPDGCQLGAKKRGEGLLYAPTEADNAAFRTAVSALIGAPVDYFDARVGTPTVAQMENYTAVLTWVNYAYSDKVAMGNNLADYVDGGGAVILGQWTLCTAGNCLGGRIMTDPGYNPATATTRGSGTYSGDGVACMHEGVVSYASDYRDNISIVSGATSDGTWTDGIPAVAYWDGAPLVFYSPGHTGGLYSTGDWALLTANIINNCLITAHDCNDNQIPDDCDIADCDGSLWCQDADGNGYPDVCDPDCDGDGIPDAYEISSCPPGDLTCADCNGNKIPDGCDIEDGTSLDCQLDGIPDECQLEDNDCNENGIPDDCDIASGTSFDIDGNGVPDECQEDCNGNGVLDGCDISCEGDCAVWYPDQCGLIEDCQPDGIPDDCQLGAGKKRGEGLLYAPSEADNAGFRAAVSALIGAPVDYFDARTGTPTVAQMEAYAAVLPWANYAFADKVAFGNNLADYVDGGGVVILGQWCLCTAGNCLGGRIMTDPGYNPAAGASWGSSSYAGDGVECMHEGVVSYEASYRDNISLVAGAISDGTWLDGTPAVAYWPNATPPVFYTPGNTGLHYTTGDWALLTANILNNCLVPPGSDCNGNGVPDECDIADCDGSLWCQDCNENGLPDICDPDCDADGIPDECVIANCDGDPSCLDCNENEIPDGCDIANCDEEENWCQDCNENEVPDGCDIDSGFATDCNDNGIPDSCEPMDDCNGDGIPDICDPDCNENGISDVCDILWCTGEYWCQDCQGEFGDGIPDGCQLGDGKRADPNVLLYSEYVAGTDAYKATLDTLGWAYTYTSDPNGLAALISGGGWTHIIINHTNTGSTYTWQDALPAYLIANPDVKCIVSDWRATAAYLGTLGFTTTGQNNYTSLSPVAGGLFDGFPTAPLYNPGYGIFALGTGGGINEAIQPAGSGAITRSLLNECWFFSGPGGDCWNDLAIAGQYMTAMLQCGSGPTGEDCNENLIPDECDIEDGTSGDCNENDIPDECEEDCNDNGVADECDIDYGTSLDCNDDLVPDECQVPPICPDCVDCQLDGIPDDCQLGDNDCNDNGIPDDCDIASGFSNDCQGDEIPDECQLYDPARLMYQYDDGSTENSLGWTAGGEMCWFHRFTAEVGADAIDTVLTSFGSLAFSGSSGVTPGQTVRVFFWSDPNGDGNPADAVLVHEQQTTAQASAIDTDVPQAIAISPPICITTAFPNANFFVGVSVVHPASTYPVPMDQGVSSLGRAYICGMPSGVFDPTVLTNLYEMDAIGFNAVHILRANGLPCGAPPNDCNENGIPDECDIGTEWGGYCEGPDCSTDYNGNGVPDECELCGDFDDDGDVDATDYWYIHDGMGCCSYSAEPCLTKYTEHVLADMDGDGCITFVDYQAWIMCYRMANGKDFVVPKAKLLPKAAPQQMPKGSFGSDSLKIP